MKEWTIDEFVNECEKLMRNMYTYNDADMPNGTCNGHTVSLYKGSWCSVVIDNCIYNLGVINERYPNGSTCWHWNNNTYNSLEYVRGKLEHDEKDDWGINK